MAYESVWKAVKNCEECNDIYRSSLTANEGIYYEFTADGERDIIATINESRAYEYQSKTLEALGPILKEVELKATTFFLPSSLCTPFVF